MKFVFPEIAVFNLSVPKPIYSYCTYIDELTSDCTTVYVEPLLPDTVLNKIPSNTPGVFVVDLNHLYVPELGKFPPGKSLSETFVSF